MVKTSPAPKSMPQLLRSGGTDGQARAYLSYFKLLSTRYFGEYSMLEPRRIWRLMAFVLGRREPVAAVMEHAIPGPMGMIRLRVLRTGDSLTKRHGLLWWQGGGPSLAVHSMLDAYGVTSALALTQQGV